MPGNDLPRPNAERQTWEMLSKDSKPRGALSQTFSGNQTHLSTQFSTLPFPNQGNAFENLNIMFPHVTNGRFIEKAGAMQSLRRLTFPPILAALFLCLTFSIPAQARETPQQIAARRSFVAQYNLIDQAFARGDIASFSSVLAPDFQFFSIARFPQSRELHLSLQTRAFNGSTRMKRRTQIQGVQWRGPDAVVWILSSLESNPGGQPMQITTMTRDYWGLVNGKWMIRQTAENKARMIYNGQTTFIG